MSNIVNGEFLMDALMNALKVRQQEGIVDQTFFHALLRPEVGLFKDGQEVYLADQLTEFFSQVTQIVHEKEYQNKEEIMLRVGLPAGYNVVPARIFAEDVPPAFYRKLNVQPLSPQKRDKMLYLCEEISPSRLNQGTLARYQCITVKIRKESLSLKSWVPGVDEEAGYQHLNNPLFLIGKHFSKQEKAAEIQRRQSLGQAKKPQAQQKEESLLETAVLTLADLLK